MILIHGRIPVMAGLSLREGRTTSPKTGTQVIKVSTVNTEHILLCPEGCFMQTKQQATEMRISHRKHVFRVDKSLSQGDNSQKSVK